STPLPCPHTAGAVGCACSRYSSAGLHFGPTPPPTPPPPPLATLAGGGKRKRFPRTPPWMHQKQPPSTAERSSPQLDLPCSPCPDQPAPKTSRPPPKAESSAS